MDAEATSGEPTPTARLGPLVRRSVHHGALLWFVGILQFLVAMAVTESVWSYPYSLSSNAISDLGNTGCGPWPHATSSVVCSPWYFLFDGSAIVLGLLVVVGAILVKSAFPQRKSSTVGLGLLLVSGIGTAGVGSVPENVYLPGHLLFATLALGIGGVALLALSVAMMRDTRWDGYRAYTLLSGAISVVAFVLLATGHDFGLGYGGMERLTAGPEFLWLIVASVHLLYIPTFAPKAIAT